MKDKLIIFDMDNTLIHSRIDFPLMKAETLRLLHQAGLEPDVDLPVAHMLNEMRTSGALRPDLEAVIWRRISEIEADGLAGAELEPGVEPVMAELAEQAHLAVLTNNMQQAAQANLERLGLQPYFEVLFGRGSVPALKPQPDGMLAVLARFPHLTAAQALTVGDAFIDIAAAQAAGMRFVAYNRSRDEDWQALPHQPLDQLTSWDEEAAARILNCFA